MGRGLMTKNVYLQGLIAIAALMCIYYYGFIVGPITIAVVYLLWRFVAKPAVRGVKRLAARRNR